MKRLIAAVSFAVLSTPALAQNTKPFEQLDLDRALPHVAERSVNAIVASSGETRSDVEISTEATEVRAASPWANDHNFIAPAQ
jgi:hypothetical protein